MNPKWFGFRRTPEEQLLGLEPLLADVAGKTVLDLGCAEGDISLRFMDSGAEVVGWDNNEVFVRSALSKGVKALWFDLNKDHWPEGQYDVVLALAVIHKLKDPVKGLRNASSLARDLLVVRLPEYSTGSFRTKHSGVYVDLFEELPRNGFSLEREIQGPRNELVQYWKRDGDQHRG